MFKIKINKTVIILLLIISIGFAYLSTNLNIGTLIGYSGNTWDIYFDNLREETYKTEIVNTASISNKTTVNFSISLDQPTSTYRLYADIYNGGTLDAMLDSWTLTNTLSGDEAKAIDISVSYADGTPLSQYDLLVAKLHEYVEVKVVYKETISNDELLSSAGSLTCSLTMNYIQADENAKVHISKNWLYITNLYQEGTSISTTDHDGELRFIGANPNNYVTFNGNQTWRVIGVFDGLLKLYYTESIGDFSWDTSHYGVNRGWGINQWGASTYSNGNPYGGADLMKLLNPGYEDNVDLIGDSNTSGLVNNSLYWNAGSGLCYNGSNNKNKECSFTSNGLNDNESKLMIDDHVWNLGSLDNPEENIWDGRINAALLYQWERSNDVELGCTNESAYCTDTVVRTSTWQGKVGLLYPSDWVYATGGGSVGRSNCLSYSSGLVSDNSVVTSWAKSLYSDCYQDDWLYSNYSRWSISPRRYNSKSNIPFAIKNKYIGDDNGCVNLVVNPVVYLKRNVSITSGDGSIGNPYVLTRY